jgi:hypothetical protein
MPATVKQKLTRLAGRTNTRFAMSSPYVVAFIWGLRSLSGCVAAPLWHIDAVRSWRPSIVPDSPEGGRCPFHPAPIQHLFYRSYRSFQIASWLIATQPSMLTTLIDIARQAHHARLTVSGFAVTISSARLCSIVPCTVAVHRHRPLR